MIKHLTIVLVTAMALTGCSLFEKPKTKTVYVKPNVPAELLVDTEIPKPSVSVEEYNTMNFNQKEKVLMELAYDMYEKLKENNIRMKALREILGEEKKDEPKMPVIKKPVEKEPIKI